MQVHNSTKMNNPDNETLASFTARIVDVPNQDSNGNYRYTDYRRVVDKRTGEVTEGGYGGNWYQFSGILTSIVVEGEEVCDIPPDFKIKICISSALNSEYEGDYREYVKKLNNILSAIKIYSDVRFIGMPQRVEKSRKLSPVDPTNIGNAHEIYIYPDYIGAIRVEPPTKEMLKKQSQYAQSKAKERSRMFKPGLKLRLSRFRWGIVKFAQDIGEYLKKNIVPLLVGFLLGVTSSVIGGLILHWLGVS